MLVLFPHGFLKGTNIIYTASNPNSLHTFQWLSPISDQPPDLTIAHVRWATQAGLHWVPDWVASHFIISMVSGLAGQYKISCLMDWLNIIFPISVRLASWSCWPIAIGLASGNDIFQRQSDWPAWMVQCPHLSLTGQLMCQTQYP